MTNRLNECDECGCSLPERLNEKHARWHDSTSGAVARHHEAIKVLGDWSQELPKDISKMVEHIDGLTTNRFKAMQETLDRIVEFDNKMRGN